MKAFFKGFIYAGRGWAAAWSGQRNIKVMAVIAVVAFALGLYLDISMVQWALVCLCCGLVFSLEMLNTAGEKLVDILSPDHDQRYGQIKDILAGAVLVAALFSLLVGLLIFLPPLWGMGGG